MAPHSAYFFFFNDTATTEIYTLSLHDALPISIVFAGAATRLGAEKEAIATAVVALLFGTPLFAYGLLEFSHALTAFALFAAWGLLFVKRSEFAAGAVIDREGVGEGKRVDLGGG